MGGEAEIIGAEHGGGGRRYRLVADVEVLTAHIGMVRGEIDDRLLEAADQKHALEQRHAFGLR